MNIFAVDHDPILAAQALCNAHVTKMVLESAQLLCTTHHVLATPQLPDYFYRATHKNHPCAIFTRNSLANYKWVARHGLALCEEFTYRSATNKRHASQGLIEWCLDNPPNLDQVDLTSFAQAMPDQFKDDDHVTAYRNYYLGDKMINLPRFEYTRRTPPDWMTAYVSTRNTCAIS